MADPTADDELLAILLVNLRNAEATFGQGTPPYESIRTTVMEHLEHMKSKGMSTNLVGVRQIQRDDRKADGGAGAPGRTFMITNLAFRPKKDDQTLK